MLARDYLEDDDDDDDGDALMITKSLLQWHKSLKEKMKVSLLFHINSIYNGLKLQFWQYPSVKSNLEAKVIKKKITT